MSSKRPDKQPVSPWPAIYLLRHLQAAVRLALDEAMKETGLTTSQVTVLSALWSEPRLSNADLARISSVTPQSMVPLLASLETRELIVRRPHPSGGRALPAELTPEGTKQLKLGWAAVKDVEDRMLAGMAADDQQRLSVLLGHCLASLRQGDEAKQPTTSKAKPTKRKK